MSNVNSTEMVSLPTDRDGIVIYPGDIIHLDHNNSDREVISIALNTIDAAEEANWAIYCSSGGAFLINGNRHNVSHVMR